MRPELLNEAFAPYVQQYVEHGLWKGESRFGACTGFGFANGVDGLVAGFVFHEYDPRAGTIELSAYADDWRWCTRDNLRLIFGYPFNELQVRLVVARHAETNERVRRIWDALGAKETLIPELWGPGIATAVSTLLRTDWMNSKFMSGTNGKI